MNGHSEGSLRVGCAGWSVASGRTEFGAGESVLERYATRFDTVEINSSFYRPHRRSTYQKWASLTPDGFRFSVKVPKAITHTVTTVPMPTSVSLRWRFLLIPLSPYLAR